MLTYLNQAIDMLRSRDDPRDDHVVVPPISGEGRELPDGMIGPPPREDAPCNADVLIAYLESLKVEDARAVADQLFSEYRSIPDILSARWVRLYRLVGPRLASVLRSTRVLLERAHREQLAHALNLSGSEPLSKFLLTYQGWLPSERMTAIFVDGFGRLIRIFPMAEGSVSGAPFDRLP